MSQYVCIGVPYYLGEILPERGEVEALRRSGIADELQAEWVEIEPDFADDDDRVLAVNRALAAAIKSQADKIPVVFANDCTSGLGLVKGLEAKAPAILWYDSHGDFNTPETTPSGFLGGMPLAALVGRGNQHLLRGLELAPIREADVIIADARNLDPEEGLMLRESDVTHYESLADLHAAPLPDKPLYIHFDTDVVDCAEMPAMSYPEPGGPSLDESIESLRRALAPGNAVGVLFSLWNETLDGSAEALAATLRLIRALI
ncbi:MAG: arginase family protein [Chloroflexi bacterium]|nr:arginase family protein [Chloroflexota bacterium]